MMQVAELGSATGNRSHFGNWCASIDACAGYTDEIAKEQFCLLLNTDEPISQGGQGGSQ